MLYLKWKLTQCIRISLVAAFLMLSLLPATTVQAAPFNCEVSFYQIISGDLKQLDPETGTYTTLPNNVTAAANALGYNTEDNYIYGLGATTGTMGHLIRFDHDGSRTDLGAPAGLPVDTYVAGDFDSSGNLWVKNFGGSATLWKIDISTNTATSLTTSIPLAISEMVYINGHLYSNNGGTTMHRIDPATGTVTNATISNGVTGNYGAGWATIDGALYFSENNSGMIYRIDNYGGNNPVAVPVLQGESAVQNDGAACPNATTPIVEIGATDDTATTTAGTKVTVSAEEGLLSNDTHSDATIISYTQPENGTVSIEPDGSYTYTPNEGFSGEDFFTYTIEDSLGNTATATVTITVQANDEEAPIPIPIPVQTNDEEAPIPGPPNAGIHNPLPSFGLVALGALGIAAIFITRRKRRFVR